jgi:hypothetical protein
MKKPWSYAPRDGIKRINGWVEYENGRNQISFIKGFSFCFSYRLPELLVYPHSFVGRPDQYKASRAYALFRKVWVCAWI